MLKQYALPEANVMRELESELLLCHQPDHSAGAGAEPLLAFYQVWRDRYGVAACKRLYDAGGLQASGAVAVMARLLHRNASYRAMEICRQAMADRTAAGLPGALTALEHVLPASVRSSDCPLSIARHRLLQCCRRDIDGMLSRSDWRDGHRTEPHEVALYSLYRMTVQITRLSVFLGRTARTQRLLFCAGLLQAVSGMVIRHRRAVMVQALPLTLRLALVMQWLLGDNSGESAQKTLVDTKAQLKCLEEKLQQGFVLRATTMTDLEHCATEEQQRCLAAMNLNDDSSAAYVSGQASTASYKLSLNYHAMGRRLSYQLADSLRVVFFLALQQHYRLSGHQRRLLGRVINLLLSDRPAGRSVNIVTTAVMELEAGLVCRLWQVARQRVGRTDGDAQARVGEPLVGQYSSLQDQLAAGLAQLPAADIRLASDPVTADEQWCQTMMAELALLAAGARRLKVYRIAALAGVMLAVYQRLAAARPKAWTSNERSLLQRAHHRLKRMLDQAAAWQEVAAAHTVIRQLYDWLGQGDAGGDSPDAITQCRRLNRQIRAGLKLWAHAAGQGEDASGELVLLLELLQGQDELMLRWQNQHRQA